MLTSVRSIVALLLLPSLTATDSLPQCQFITHDDQVAKYHLDGACDRVAQNSFGNHARRQRRVEELHSTSKGIQNVPNEKTVTCPLHPTSLYPANAMEDNNHVGLHTTWLLENTSKLPVVVAYVDPTTGQEVSAVNSKISPPHADPQSILMPRQWKSFSTMEGHVFHVYELIGTNGNYHMGRLVLQHRVGLIPIENKHASSEAVQCGDPSSIVDEPPMVESPMVEETWEVAPDFQRTPAMPQQERCNVLYRGFRNMVGCPVHAYYIGQSQPPLNNNGGAMECNEDFKFHLGVNNYAMDFQNDWDAPTKFETTFISHTYVFRLASDINVMVDSYTFTPTHVIDCPEQGSGIPLRNRQVSAAVAASVGMPFADKTNGNAATLNQPKLVLTTSMMGMMAASPNKNATDGYDEDDETSYYYPSGTNNSSHHHYKEPSRRKERSSNRQAYYATSFASSSRAY